MPKQLFMLLYDSEADVVYLDFYSSPRSSDDAVNRYGDRDEVVGLAILHASTRAIAES